MRRTALAVSMALPIAWMINCSNDDSAPSKLTGSGGSSSTGSTSSGSGGDSTGSTSAGTTSSTGAAGTTSTTSAGGNGGASPATTTGGGSNPAGTGGAGGSPAGTGGTGGAGGAAGGAGGAGGGGPITIDGFACIRNTFGDCFSNSWMIFGCYSQAAQDCITNKPGTACPNQNAALPMEEQGLVTNEYFTMGGTPGTMYRVSIQVNGVTEGKYYQAGTRAAGDTVPANINGNDGIDGFYTGGNPVNVENYNIYKISVRNPPTVAAMPASGTEVAHYYLNSVPGTGTQFESHNSFAFGYKHDIVVPGGGVIQYHTADRNCHAIDNCGPGSRSTTCLVTDGRVIPNEPTVVIPPTYLGDPITAVNTRNGANQPFHAQILHITVTAVVPM
jgi:hypothetical protein